MTRPVLYEINTRCWLADLSVRAGRLLTLADIPPSEFESWQRRGFTHIWLMGVWSLGSRSLAWSQKCYAGRESELSCSDIAGSPYAIHQYTVSEKLGGDSALAAFRAKLQHHGLKLILDFVPNHTALDHPWVKTHPDYFVTSRARRAGAIKPYRGAPIWYAHGHCGHGFPWVDTLQLEYRNPALRAAMLRELETIAARCDGVRCDMAMLVLNRIFANTWRKWGYAFAEPSSEFWSHAIASVKAEFPRFLFLAEVYWDLEERLQELGFDFTYDKRLYDKIVARDAAGAAKHVRAHALQYITRSALFIENHDEPRIASLLSPGEHRAAAFLISVLPGLPFYHDGQFHGARLHANVHFAKRGSEPLDAALERWYDELFTAIGESKVGRGEPVILEPGPAWADNPSHQAFVIVKWQCGPAEFDLAVVNLASHPSQCFAPVVPREAAQGNWTLRDRFSSETHCRPGDDLASRGLYLDLPGHAFRLFQCTWGDDR